MPKLQSILLGTLCVTLASCERIQPENCEGLVMDNSIHINGVDVSWTTTGSTTLSIAYTIDGGEAITRVISDSKQTDHTGRLYGLPALAEIAYTATADSGEDVTTCEGSLTTGNLPPGLPQISLTVHDPDQISSERYLVGTAMQESDSYPFIIDREGEVVWYWMSDEIASVPQVEVASDGRGMLIGTFSFDRSIDTGAMIRVDLFGEIIESIPMTNGHHFFEQLSDDTFAYPSIDVREWGSPKGNTDVVGDAVVEVTVLDDGEDRVEVFNIWDWREPEVHEFFWGNFYPQGSDWSHLNSIHTLPDDQLIISLPFLSTALVIERSTGSVLREFSPEEYTFVNSGLVEAHDLRLIDDGQTLTAISHYPAVTIAIEYEIDEEAKTLTPVWTHDAGIRSNFMGQFHRLENGNRLINYGSAGIIQEVTESGEVVWELQSELGSWFGNSELIDDVYEAGGI
ncbi:MAG: aryl-sulfate sulfotransferase [Myxococcota bacterium]|nr:aryl-sulfate sulfotransferase [Myxococcota bacterium]